MALFFAIVWYAHPVPSVATTSTKPPGNIKKDIRRVLDRMQVQYRETKTGFECIHLPSIDLSSVQPVTSPKPKARHPHKGSSSDSASETDTMRRSRSLARKPSIMSLIRGKDKEPKDNSDRMSTATREKKDTTSRPSAASHSGDALATTPSGSSSFFNVIASHTDPATENLPAAVAADDTATLASGITSNTTGTTGVLVAKDETPTPRPRSPGSPGTKTLPPIPRDFGGNAPAANGAPVAPSQGVPLPTGEVDDEVFANIRKNSLSVRFEINIVKVRPLASCLVTCSNVETGSHVTSSRHPVPARWRRRLAIPHAGKKGAHGTEALIFYVYLSFSVA
jgi:serine/threonine protein kinase KIN1/2